MPIQACHNEIWDQLITGDQQALLQLYDQHYVGLFNYGIKLCADKELTRDCITQILLRLWDKHTTLPRVRNVRSYLLTCLRHEISFELGLQRRRADSYAGLQHERNEDELPYEEYIIRAQTDQHTKDLLSGALAKLTEREKELLQMKFFEDLDYDEIAERCGITKRTAYNIIHKAIGHLRSNLAGHFLYNFASRITSVTLAIAFLTLVG